MGRFLNTVLRVRKAVWRDREDKRGLWTSDHRQSHHLGVDVRCRVTDLLNRPLCCSSSTFRPSSHTQPAYFLPCFLFFFMCRRKWHHSTKSCHKHTESWWAPHAFQLRFDSELQAVRRLSQQRDLWGTNQPAEQQLVETATVKHVCWTGRDSERLRVSKRGCCFFLQPFDEWWVAAGTAAEVNLLLCTESSNMSSECLSVVLAQCWLSSLWMLFFNVYDQMSNPTGLPFMMLPLMDVCSRCKGSLHRWGCTKASF